MAKMEKLFGSWFLEMKRMCEKEGNGQTCLLYRATRENSLTVRLELFAINGHNHPMNLTAEIEDSSYFEISGDDLGKRNVTRLMREPRCHVH